MLRGEIRLTDLDPTRGSEANKRRPAVIVSNDRANAVAGRLGRGVVTVVPITTNTARVFPFQTLLTATATGFGVETVKAKQPLQVAPLHQRDSGYDQGKGRTLPLQ